MKWLLEIDIPDWLAPYVTLAQVAWLALALVGLVFWSWFREVFQLWRRA